MMWEREWRKNRITLNRYMHTQNVYTLRWVYIAWKHSSSINKMLSFFLSVRQISHFLMMLFKFSLISGTIDPNDIKWWNKPNQRTSENFYDERALKKRQQQQKFIVQRIYTYYTDLDTDTSAIDLRWIKVFPQWWITLHRRYCCCDFTSVCYYYIGPYWA